MPSKWTFRFSPPLEINHTVNEVVVGDKTTLCFSDLLNFAEYNFDLHKWFFRLGGCLKAGIGGSGNINGPNKWHLQERPCDVFERKAPNRVCTHTCTLYASMFMHGSSGKVFSIKYY